MTRQLGYFLGLRFMLAWVIAMVTLYLSPACAGGPVYDKGLVAFSMGDIATAFQLWRPLAEHGDADAQFSLGSLYYDGIGVPIDHTESSYWFHLAAEQGHAEAQYNLGNAYIRGEGVHQNDAMATHWWRKAAEQGLEEAQFNLDQAYKEGVGVEKDEQTAAHLYQELVDKGSSSSLAMSTRLDKVAQPESGADCEGWLGKQPPNAYTIQLMSTTRPNDVYDLARQHSLSGYIICSYAHEGRTRHALLVGVYPSVGAASEAVNNLPIELKNGKPWIRKIKGINQLVADHAR